MSLTEYDIGGAFKAIEDELIASMIRRGPRGPCGLKYNMLYIHMLFLSTTAGYVVYFSWPIS